MSSPLHVTLSTGSHEAKLFFVVAQYAAEFAESGYLRRRRFRPSFIIYQETLYRHPLTRFKTGDAGNNYFKFYEELSYEEFDCLFWMILDENEAFEKEKEEAARQIGQKADHMVDAMRYHLSNQYNPPVNGLEKRLIDNLNIPGLETALREAVKRENYEAAAYIRDRVQAQDHVIIEDPDGKLIIRMTQDAVR